MEEGTQGKPLVNKENTSEKQQVVEERTMPLLVFESFAISEQILSIKIRYRSPNSCKNSEVRIASK
jgi:hypothetical protein